jgi:hypothetical protein
VAAPASSAAVSASLKASVFVLRFFLFSRGDGERHRSGEGERGSAKSAWHATTGPRPPSTGRARRRPHRPRGRRPGVGRARVGRWARAKKLPRRAPPLRRGGGAEEKCVLARPPHLPRTHQSPCQGQGWAAASRGRSCSEGARVRVSVEGWRARASRENEQRCVKREGERERRETKTERPLRPARACESKKRSRKKASVRTNLVLPPRARGTLQTHAPAAPVSGA